MELWLYIAILSAVLYYGLPAVRFAWHRGIFHVRLSIFLARHPDTRCIRIPPRSSIGHRQNGMVLIRGNMIRVVALAGLFRKLSQLVLDADGTWYRRTFSPFAVFFGGGDQPAPRKTRSHAHITAVADRLRHTLWQETEEWTCEALVVPCPPMLTIFCRSGREITMVPYGHLIHGVRFTPARDFFHSLAAIPVQPTEAQADNVLFAADSTSAEGSRQLDRQKRLDHLAEKIRKWVMS